MENFNLSYWSKKSCFNICKKPHNILIVYTIVKPILKTVPRSGRTIKFQSSSEVILICRVENGPDKFRRRRLACQNLNISTWNSSKLDLSITCLCTHWKCFIVAECVRLSTEPRSWGYERQCCCGGEPLNYRPHPTMGVL